MADPVNRDAVVDIVRRTLQREFGGFLAHDPYNPERFWTMQAEAVVDAVVPTVQGGVVQDLLGMLTQDRARVEEHAIACRGDDPVRANALTLRSQGIRLAIERISAYASRPNGSRT